MGLSRFNKWLKFNFRTTAAQIAAAGGGGGITNSAPVGDINGVNQVFVFTSPPKAVFFQGRLQDEGVDYTLTGSTVTFAIPPVDGAVKGFV